MFRKPIFLVLGKDQLAISVDIKDPTFAFNLLHFKSKLVLDGFFQTGSFRQVISHAAVFDSDMHGLS